jgi:hypothetical protein
VTETHCDSGAVDAIAGQYVVVEGARGVLAMRKANPSVCTHIFWTRFEPAQDNSGSFELTLVRNGKPSKVQASEPGNPMLAAWTVGVYAEPGDKLEACLTSGDGKKCLETTVV